MRGNGAWMASSFVTSRSSTLQFLAPVLQHAADDEDDHLLGHALHVFQRGVGHLRLHHPELGQVAARLGFLGAEGGAEAVDLAERHGGGFVIELAGLREVGLVVVEVIHLEQRGGAFAGRRREDGRIHQGEAVRIEIIAHRLDHFVAHADDGVLALAAQPQVAVVHQEIDAVLLGRDGIRVGFRHALHHFQVLHVHLVAAGRALFGADLAGDDDGRFLGQVLDGLEQLFGQGALHGHALHQAGSRRAGSGTRSCRSGAGCTASRRSRRFRRRAGRLRRW